MTETETSFVWLHGFGPKYYKTGDGSGIATPSSYEALNKHIPTAFLLDPCTVRPIKTAQIEELGDKEKSGGKRK